MRQEVVPFVLAVGVVFHDHIKLALPGRLWFFLAALRWLLARLGHLRNGSCALAMDRPIRHGIEIGTFLVIAPAVRAHHVVSRLFGSLLFSICDLTRGVIIDCCGTCSFCTRSR